MSEENIEQQSQQPPEEEMDAVVEFTSPADYIHSAWMVWDMVSEMDTALISKADEKRVKRMRRQALRIASVCLNDLYDELFEDDSDED